MGLFDFLRKSGSQPPQAPEGKAPSNKKVASLAKVVSDKRAQTYDRADAIKALADMKTVEAAETLLRRFSFSIDPSITDQEEKEMAFDGVVAVGEDVVPDVLAYCKKAEVLSWPLRILRQVLDDDAYGAKLIELASKFDIEYARNVEPKLQVIGALSDVKSEAVRVTVERFLEDVNENVRFSAVATTFEQDDQKSIPALVQLLEAEESVRIKNKVCDGLAEKGWKLDAELAARTEATLSDVEDFALEDGLMKRRGGFYMA